MSEVTSVNGHTGAVVLSASDVEAVPTSSEGKPSGVATLDSGGVLHEAQLPSSVASSSSVGIRTAPYSTAQVWSPGAEVDCGPRIQEAIDSGASRVKLEGNTPFYLNSGVFDDSVIGIPEGGGLQDRQVVIEGNNQTRLILGPGLPTTAAFTADAATKWGFFSGTKRSALSSGVVTCTNETAVNGSLMNAGPRMIFRHLVLDGLGANVGLCFGNHAPNEIDHCTQRGLKFGLSWTGYCDGNKASSIVTHSDNGAAAAGAVIGTWIIYQITNGDRVVLENIENGSSNNFGSWRAAQCRSATVRGIVAGKIELNHCSGIVIDAVHTELTEAVFKPSIVVNNSNVTVMGCTWFAGLEAGRYFLEINDDNAGSAVGSVVKLDGCRSVYCPVTKDTERAPDIYIAAANPNTRLVVDNTDASILPIGSTVEYEGSLVIKSAVTAITAALRNSTYTAFNKATIAATRWELCREGEGGAWTITSAVRGITSFSRQTAPTLALQASTVWEGTLTSAQSYSYAVAGMDDAGRHTVPSSPSELAATAIGAIYVEATITAAPLGLIVWRKAGAGVLTAPDVYAILPVGTVLNRMVDTGSHINGIAWVSTSVPVPNTNFTNNTTCSGVRLANGVEVLSGPSAPNLVEIPAAVGSTYLYTSGGPGQMLFVKTTGSAGQSWQLSRDLHTATITENYTTSSSDGHIAANAVSGKIEVTLANMTNNSVAFGHEVTVKKTDSSANPVVLKAQGEGATIDGSATYALTKKNQAVTLVSNGANYEVKSASADESSKLLFPSSWPAYKEPGTATQESKPVVAEAYPRWRVQAELALASGTPMVCAIAVPAHVVISGIVWFVNAAEGTPVNRTHLWVALLNSAGKVLRASADFTSSANTSMSGGSRRGLLLASTYETTEPMLLYAMVCETMSSTAPIKIAGTTVTTGVTEAPPVLYATGPAGQTVPPTIGETLALTAAANAPYLAFV